MDDEELDEPTPSVKRLGTDSSNRYTSLSDIILAQIEEKENIRSDRRIAKQRKLKAKENKQFLQKAFVPVFDDEDDDEDFKDEDVSVKISKSTGVGVNMDAPLRQSKQEKEMKKSTGPRVKRVQ